jgi:2-keto-3-deoxy-L-rhamnonate aldolase RhmA
MKNRLKERLRNGEVTYGVSVGTACLDIVSALSRLPFDWIWYDAEHGVLNTEILHAMLHAGRGGRASSLVRVPWNDMVHIKKALDIGAEGLIIPWVNNREQAEAAVRAAKYPPQGIRGIGPRFTLFTGEDGGEYLRTANDEVFIMVQIETMEAVTNLDEILTTPGVDAFLIGPSDLSASMGYLGQPLHPEVEEVVAGVIRRGKQLGVPGGYASASIDINRKRIEQGFQLITLGGDLGMMVQGARSLLAAFGRS